MRISDWSSDVCSSDSRPPRPKRQHHRKAGGTAHIVRAACRHLMQSSACQSSAQLQIQSVMAGGEPSSCKDLWMGDSRSEEHTSELLSLMRLSYAVFCLKKNNRP